jgi:hypothetical protein
VRASLKIVHGQNSEHKADNSQNAMAVKDARKMGWVCLPGIDNKSTYHFQQAIKSPAKPYSGLLVLVN